jgi:peptidyl-dipeptidase A
LSFDGRRKLNFLKQGIVLPAPETPGAATELSTIATKLQSQYGKGKGTLGGQPINGSDIEAAMGTTRDPARLKEMWTSWHDQVGAPMREDYARLVSIANAGAKELGYADVGVMWRSGYDMSDEEFAREMERLWQQVKPLYDQLHCYVRAKLSEHYGPDVQPATGPIRADLLGNMWAQEWGNIYPLVAPPGSGDIGYNLTSLLVEKGYDPIKMVKVGEGFYTSLGLPALPATFWERSQFVKPRDREVVCHASAWDLDNQDDLRIKMCIKVNGDDFITNSAITITSAPTSSSLFFISAARMTDFMRRSAISSRCPSRRSIWCKSACWTRPTCPVRTKTSACYCIKPWTRWRFCPSAC